LDESDTKGPDFFSTTSFLGALFCVNLCGPTPDKNMEFELKSTP